MNRIAMRFLLLITVFVSVSSTIISANAQSEQEAAKSQPLKIGVRKFARPFSYIFDPADPQSVITNYSGYTIDICKEITMAMARDRPDLFDLPIAVPVTAKDRFNDLRDGKVDILCGPESITPNRMRSFAASIPIYLSGMGHASYRLSETSECVAVLGVTEGTTSQSEGIANLLASGKLGQFGEGISDNGGSPCDNSGKGPIGHVSDHKEGIEYLCSGKFLYYAADIEILLSMNGTDCGYTVSPGTSSVEKYAIYFRKPANGNNERDAVMYYQFDARLNELVLSQPSILYEQYRRHLGRYTMSDDLKAFLESITGEPFNR